MKTKKTKLRGKTKKLASKYIAEEMSTHKYGRKQAIAIGISRARTKTAKAIKAKAARTAKKKAHR